MSVVTNGSIPWPSASSAQPHYLEIAADDFVSSHPELHHYTNFSGLSGIIGSNTLWATHFSNLNDTSEIDLLAEPLAKAIANRLLNYILIRKGTDFQFLQLIKSLGDPVDVANTKANELVDIMYRVTFDNLSCEPFIASFCSHADDQVYEQENGLLSQWRGYGNDGGFCIVFDTAELVQLLTKEFALYNWALLKIAPVYYALENNSIESLFPELLERCSEFFTRMIDGKRPIDESGDGLAPFFISGAPRFKHQGFREEREVRIVAIPAACRVLKEVVKQIPGAGTKDRAKHISQREGFFEYIIRYVVLFDALNCTLPIKRIIVGPSGTQDLSYEQARAITPIGIPVNCSATPLLR